MELRASRDAANAKLDEQACSDQYDLMHLHLGLYAWDFFSSGVILVAYSVECCWRAVTCDISLGGPPLIAYTNFSVLVRFTLACRLQHLELQSWRPRKHSSGPRQGQDDLAAVGRDRM